MKLTIKDISSILLVDEETVRRWCRTGKLEYTQTSKKEGYIIDDLDFINFLNDRPKYKKIFEFSGKKAILEVNKYRLEELKKEVNRLESLIERLEEGV